jgi:rhodanese-related sulfurtransferase
VTNQSESTSAAGRDVPVKKQTSLGLYVTAQEAYEMWKADPEHVHVIDVRTPEEYVFVGHPEMARNVPVVFVKHQWDVEEDEFVVERNPGFIARMQALYVPGDTLLVMCRSGARSAASVNALASAGYSNAWNVIDGMEGDKLNDPSSPNHGKRVVNGWKNSGSPWTYGVEPDLLWTDSA